MAIDIIADIVPVTKVREHLSAIIARAKETKQPIVLTQNGSAAVVILDAAQYQKERDEATYLHALLDGLLSEGEVSPEEVNARLDTIISE